MLGLHGAIIQQIALHAHEKISPCSLSFKL